MNAWDDLSDEQRAAVIAAVRQVLDQDRYPRAPRLAPLRDALAKLDPASLPAPREPRPPLPRIPKRRPTRR